MRSNMTRLDAKLINGFWGDYFTKRFLSSKHVVIVSEGDYLSRLKICVRSIQLIPIFLLFVLVFVYYKIAIEMQYKGTTNPELLSLIRDQKNVIYSMIAVNLVHILMLSYCLIVMLNQTMGRFTSAFTMIFNFIYIFEALFFGSIIFIFDWTGVIKHFTSVSDFGATILSKWIYVFIYVMAFVSYKFTKKIFVEINVWNREWIRIDKYRKTEDRENAFIFRTWVTPGEITARRYMISAAWFFIFAANSMTLVDMFNLSSFQAVKFIVLIIGYMIFIGTFVIPYNKISLIFYWGGFAFSFIILAIGLYHVQNTAWKGNWSEYSYLSLFIPFILTLKASIAYTWTIRNKEEIQAIVISEFESAEEFSNYLEENKLEEGQEVLTSQSLDV